MIFRSILWFDCRKVVTLFVMFTVLLVLFGCKKHKLDEDQEECIGDYEWVYTTNSSLNTTNQEDIIDRYAVRIKKNSKVYVFKNGKQIYKGAIRRIDQYSNGDFKISTTSDNEFVNFNYVNGNLISKDWPFENDTNYYIKL